MLPVRRIFFSAPGNFADADWTNPANVPPTNSRRIKITSTKLLFALRGRASSDPEAAVIDLGALTVDAFVVIESEGGGYSRGRSLAEVEGDAIEGQLRFVGIDVEPGEVGLLNITLTGAPAGVVEVLLAAGGRVL